MNLFPAFRIFMAQASKLARLAFMKFKYNGSPQPDGAPEILEAVFSRPNNGATSGATVFDKSGKLIELAEDQPDWSFEDGCPVLKMRPQRTNLLQRSEEFDNADWIKVGTTITPNDFIAPNGTMAADKMSISGGGSRVIQSVGLGATTVTFSVYLYSNTSFTLRLVGFVDSANDSREITIPAGKWTRFSETFTSTISISNVQIRGEGVDTGDIFVWGAQVEEGSTATSYIPTTSAAVTRSANQFTFDAQAILTGDYSFLIEASSEAGRLQYEDDGGGFEVPLTGSGRIVGIYKKNEGTVTLHFPDNDQPQTSLTYFNVDSLNNFTVSAKIAGVGIKLLAQVPIELTNAQIEDYVSGDISSPLIETDWSSETSFSSFERDNNWNYFPFIDTSLSTSFVSFIRDNNLTEVPLFDTSSGENFASFLFGNNLTEVPLFDTSSGTDFNGFLVNNNLTTFPASFFDQCPATNYGEICAGNNINATGVDNILISINKAREDGFSGPDGNLTISGTNDAPTAAGIAAKNALIADGWTVVTN